MCGPFTDTAAEIPLSVTNTPIVFRKHLLSDVIKTTHLLLILFDVETDL